MSYSSNEINAGKAGSVNSGNSETGSSEEIRQQNQDLCMDWDAAIESDDMKYTVLDAGDYTFTVTNFERSRFPGSAKLPACNKAVITAAVHAAQGDVAVRFNLLLCRTLEWRLASFFRCIGQKQHGERLVMDWSKVPGARGRAHFRPRVYTDKYGEEKTVNDLDRFIDYDPDFFHDGTPEGFTVVLSDDENPFL